MALTHTFSPAWLLTHDKLRWWARAFAVGSLIHVCLPDFEQPGWAAPQIVETVGALLLLWRPTAWGFLLCTLGTLYPLFFLRDVLTQSMYLTWVGFFSCMATVVHRIELMAIVRWLTAGTYWLAALHKMNRDFFNPEISCAHHALRQLDSHWQWASLPTDLGVELSILVIGIECIIGVLIVRRSLLVWPVGCLFHWGLTVTLAPAFGLVMLSGYCATLNGRQMVLIRHLICRRKTVLSVSIASLIAVEGLLSQQIPSVMTVLKAALFFGSVTLSIGLILEKPSGHLVQLKPEPIYVKLIFIFWIGHGLTPYFGLQYQHAAAMLSNLRIDRDCYNSLLIPPLYARHDPYIRLNHASIGDGQRPKREVILKEGLWNLVALSTMRRNWCIPELRPITLEGSWTGRAFRIGDLCSPDWYSHLGLSEPPWPGFQLYQKNLKRRCLTPCIH
ncbi:MAG: hypothetical protein VYA30_10505 [Myxococcota bacterium]|nr:hypothetical protein [Myxococcota bacterium]